MLNLTLRSTGDTVPSTLSDICIAWIGMATSRKPYNSKAHLVAFTLPAMYSAQSLMRRCFSDSCPTQWCRYTCSKSASAASGRPEHVWVQLAGWRKQGLGKWVKQGTAAQSGVLHSEAAVDPDTQAGQ